MKAFREAIRIMPDYADAHANLGGALTSTDDEQAIRELEKAVALAPDSVKAQFNLAVAYGRFGPRRERDRTTPQGDRPRAQFSRGPTSRLGKALVRDGKIPEAVEELQQAARLDPQSGESHYQLGLALTRAGRKDEAAAEVQKGRELSSAEDRNRTRISISPRVRPPSTKATRAGDRNSGMRSLFTQSPWAQHYTRNRTREAG